VPLGIVLASCQWEGKKQLAIKWLNQQDPQWKRERDIKTLLKAARRTAGDTRLTLVLAGFILLRTAPATRIRPVFEPS
jgi:hypothetical protein